jgi:hypothetical protein
MPSSVTILGVGIPTAIEAMTTRKLYMQYRVYMVYSVYRLYGIERIKRLSARSPRVGVGRGVQDFSGGPMQDSR